VKAIAKQWAEAPTFIMDATLPAIEVLRVFYPKVEVVADIDATMPHVTVRQMLGAPASSRKLGIVKERDKPPRIEPPEGNRNLQAIRRAILHRHLELGRKPTLVIAQKAVAEWLKPRLPNTIKVEWFNNIAGLDGYKDVRLLITIGRTLPNVIEVEAYAGALTGIEPVKTTAQPEKGPRWFDRITRGIRLKDGTGYAVEGDHHPDPMAEAIRWQIAEGELVQAIGRARGVNRTAATPLAIDIMADVVLPITIDEVVPWEKVPASAEVEMLVEGVWLDSPTDMAKAWPKVWETAEAARRWQSRTTSGQNPIENILYRTLPACGRYQRPGERQKWRTFRYSPDVIPDPAAWLTDRLGPLAGIWLDTPHVGILDALFDAAAVGRPEPPASHSITCFEPRQGEPAPCHRGHVRLCAVEISL
jgi:putative DNA primase/helicase